MYGVQGFGSMMHDRLRVDSYVKALEKHVTPETVVLDIGTGTGIFAFVAAGLGAKHVYAVEPEPAISVASEIAVANGLADRITFMNTKSTEVTLPEKADVIVGDLRGLLPFINYNVPSFIDARERLANPDAVFIPQRDDLFVAPGYAGHWYAKLVKAPWRNQPYGIDMSAGAKYIINTLSSGPHHLRKGEVLRGDPRKWCEIHYATATTADFDGHSEWTFTEPTTLNVFVLWFDATLTDGIWFTAKPGEIREDAVYGQMGMPLPEEIEIEAGDQVALDISVKLINNSYVWAWHTTIRGDDGQIKHQFKQTNFHNIAINMKRNLQKQLQQADLQLSPQAKADSIILQALWRRIAVAKIIERVQNADVLGDQDVARYVQQRVAEYTLAPEEVVE